MICPFLYWSNFDICQLSINVGIYLGLCQIPTRGHFQSSETCTETTDVWYTIIWVVWGYVLSNVLKQLGWSNKSTPLLLASPVISILFDADNRSSLNTNRPQKALAQRKQGEGGRFIAHFLHVQRYQLGCKEHQAVGCQVATHVFKRSMIRPKLLKWSMCSPKSNDWMRFRRNDSAMFELQYAFNRSLPSGYFSRFQVKP